MGALVLAALLVALLFLAVTVRLPAVWRVTLKVPLPETSAALAGKLALLSEELIPTVSATVLTRFQFASTALTVTVKAVPAVWAAGEPVLPVALPGEAVSPGAKICSLVNAPELTVREELVLAVTAAWVRSEAVTVTLPEVLSVTLRLLLPLTSAALAGRVALLAEALMPTASVTVLTAFQLAATALTVTLKALPAACAAGVPVFPVALPGAVVSPGARICSLVKTPALTASDGLVLLVIPVRVTSEAVTVALPAGLSVTLK